ncbi:LPXTG cell wall anchor domain-containing protein [Glycomyces harbinensis]|uniref:LPXTG-motif cell wall anchor domain-containing protein n=1 Tax=Glycomyces harbinensis TaxID=58114 RepID=A0A1G6YT91_9ACTN|nr:LPXTG cell wall anchor domain-containing protein [Glycomyces harbinensis]SDD93502.1 LPXTG-motif cell wall anchor domain-containing protein [Glycomyces harbinensis]
MSAPKNRFGRAFARTAAAAGAAALGAGAFALPASAQAPVPVSVDLDIASEVVADNEHHLGGLTLEFGEDFAEGEHDVTAHIDYDTGSGLRLLQTYDWDGCGLYADTGQFLCIAEDADNPVEFAFEYKALVGAVEGVHDYTVTVDVDGETVETIEGTVEVLPYEGDGYGRPYLLGNAAYDGVEPGSTVDVAPEFLQESALSANAEAVVVTTWAPEYLPHGLAWPGAGYDNCIVNEGVNVTCVVTDFEDLPGTVFTFDTPIGYTVHESAPGPVDVCDCVYEVYTVGADRLEADFGGVFWDEGSGDLFGLRTVSEPESEFVDEFHGNIDITTSQQLYDLTTEAIDVKGGNGDEVTVKLRAGNEGPAGAYSFFDGPGSYAVLVELPEGVEVVMTVGGDEWNCFEGDEMGSYLDDEVTEERLAELDFICMFHELSPGSDQAMPVDVKVTDEDADGAGSVEVIALDYEDYPGDFESDPKDNKAAFTLNGGGSGRLPTTGTSLTVIYVAAGAVLVAGVVLIVLGRRRKTAGAVAE